MYAIFTMFAISALSQAPDGELPEKRERQSQVQGETEQLARRVGTMLRVLEQYKLDSTGEKKLLDEAATTLHGLSQQQMAAVLEKLDAAMAAADQNAAQAHVEAAYAGHRDALRKLKQLLGHFDSVRDLDSAAARIEKLARDELELSFRIADILQDSLERFSPDIKRKIRAIRAEFPTTRAIHEAEEQADYCREFETIMRQMESLKPALHPEHRDRITDASLVIRKHDLPRSLLNLANAIRPVERASLRLEEATEIRHRDWSRAVADGWVVSGHLQRVARALLAPRDKVQNLRESQRKLAIVLEQLNHEMRESLEFFSQPSARFVEPVDVRRRGRVDDPTCARSRQHADAAGRLGFAVRGIRHQIASNSPAAAESFDRAAESLHMADLAFRRVLPIFGRGFQTLADAELRRSLKLVEAALSRAEQERSDALVATKAALEQIEQLIKEQKQLRDNTAQSTRDQEAQRLAQRQAELAKQATEVANAPLPTGPRTKELLKEATQAMEGAATDLAERQTPPAIEKQDVAVSRLEEARNDLSEKAHKIEKRRDEIAKLQDAQQKLQQLAKDQNQVVGDATKAAEQDNRKTAPIAQAQDKLTPTTEQVSQELQPTSPKAAEAAQQAAENMKAASDQLQKNDAKSGAANAEQAAKNLQKARSEVSKQLADRRAQEAMDQSRIQPDQIDAAQAAKDVAKAMDAANDATKASEEAMQSPLTRDLVKRQENVADQARQTGQDKAANPAQKAARDLQKGDLQNAVVQQQQTLSQLQKKSELANEQKSLMDTTQALARSMESTELAQSAVQQAMAQSPEAVQQQLQQASNQLKQAGEQLQKSEPQQANQAQEQAKGALGQAMQALRQAAELARNNPPAKQQTGSKPQTGNEQQQQQPGSSEGNEMATGNRKPDAVAKNIKAQSNGVDGDGRFVNLPPRQRELIRQALTEKLPPEYASFIQQYFVNIAKGKQAATKPAGRDAKVPEGDR